MAGRGRGHFNRPIVDFTSGADLVGDATVRLLQPGTTTPITDTIYTSATGLGTRAQGWNPSDGEIDFYLDRHQVVRLGITIGAGAEQYKEALAVGSPDGRKYVTDFGAKFDGTTDDSAAINAATASLATGEPLYFPYGTGLIDADTLVLPTQDGASWVGVGGGGTNRLGGTVIKAKNGAGLWAMAATQEVLGIAEDTAQGVELRGVSFWGGVTPPGESPPPAPDELGANTLHGLVIHGHGLKVRDCQSVSANGHNIFIAGTDMGDSAIGESHEIAIHACAARFAGLDNISVGLNQEDGTIDEWTKTQYAGRHGIMLLDGAGWSIVNNHPSWAVGNLIHVDGHAWNTRIVGNYPGSPGEYMDNTGYPLTHYAIYCQGLGAVITGNTINLNSGGNQVDPVTGLRLKNMNGLVCANNTLVYHTDDHFVAMIEQSGIVSPSYIDPNTNIAYIPPGD